MTMLFTDAFDLLDIGASVSVDDGSLEPPKGSDAWRLWRHGNHQGRIIAKSDGPPRSITIELEMEQIGEGIWSTPAYEVVEGGAHVFTELDPPLEKKLPHAEQGKRSEAIERARLARLRPEEIVAEVQTQMLAALRTLFPDLVITEEAQQMLFPRAREGEATAAVSAGKKPL